MHRLYNPSLAKINRSYSVRELADVYGVHINTVGQWIKRGLQLCDDSRPVVILGTHVREFHRKNRAARRCTCQPGEIYCMGCKAARVPAGGMADYQPKTATAGAFVGICPQCESMMYRRVSLAKLSLAKGDLDISFPQAPSRIGDTRDPFVDRDFMQGASHHE